MLAALVFMASAAVAEADVLLPDSRYPEGPLAADGGVYVTEMGSDRVVFVDGGGARVVWRSPGCLPTSVEPFAGALVVLCHRPGLLAVVTREGRLLSRLGVDTEGRPFPTPNASATDGGGGVWFSSSGPFAPGAPSLGAVMHLHADGRITREAEGIHYANGVALTADGRTLYVSEHLSRNVLAFDVADDGTLSNRRVFVRLDDLVGADPERSWDVGPDGLDVDKAGNLYIAEYGGSRILIVDARGGLLADVPIGEPWVTSPELSPDEKRIYVTAPAARDPSVPGKVYVLPNPVK